MRFFLSARTVFKFIECSLSPSECPYVFDYELNHSGLAELQTVNKWNEFQISFTRLCVVLRLVDCFLSYRKNGTTLWWMLLIPCSWCSDVPVFQMVNPSVLWRGFLSSVFLEYTFWDHHFEHCIKNVGLHCKWIVITSFHAIECLLYDVWHY